MLLLRLLNMSMHVMKYSKWKDDAWQWSTREKTLLFSCSSESCSVTIRRVLLQSPTRIRRWVIPRFACGHCVGRWKLLPEKHWDRNRDDRRKSTRKRGKSAIVLSELRLRKYIDQLQTEVDVSQSRVHLSDGYEAPDVDPSCRNAGNNTNLTDIDVSPTWSCLTSSTL